MLPDLGALLFGGGDCDVLGRVHRINHFAEERDELRTAFRADCLS